MTDLSAFSLIGKVALVTGVGRGLGHGMAVALSRAGADIVGLYLDDCATTETEVTQNGSHFFPIQCDLQQATPEELNDIIATIQDELGRLDILVNNAGIIRRAPAVDYSEEDWLAVIQVNQNALFFCPRPWGG